nr:hypothetical protein [Taylorella equigenitalis]
MLRDHWERRPFDTDGGANIATQASDGQLLIGLKKALTGLTSVAIENGPTLSNAGIDAGGKPISNLKPATDTSGSSFWSGSIIVI